MTCMIIVFLKEVIKQKTHISEHNESAEKEGRRGVEEGRGGGKNTEIIGKMKQVYNKVEKKFGI